MATKIQRIKPLTITEQQRKWMVQYGTGERAIAAQELVTTSDQLRLFRRDTYLGAVDHGSVETVSELSTLYLLPSCTRGVWPDDTCWVSSQGCEYRCISGSNATAVWRAVGAGNTAGGTATWGGINGDIEAQPDLDAAFAGKANSTHSHLRSDISDSSVVGRNLLGLSAPSEDPQLARINPDGSITYIDVPSSGGGGGIVWRAVTGNASAAVGGEGIVAIGDVAQSIACDELTNDTDLLYVDGLGSALVSLTLGGTAMYSVARPTKLWVRRHDDHLIVSRLPSTEIAPSYLASIAAAGLVADLDTMYMPGVAGDSVTAIPATVGAAWLTTAGSPVVRVIGGRKGVYFGSGARATAGISPGGSYTIALVASTTNTSDYARTLAGRATNWLIGPYAGVWCFYGGGFSNFRGVTPNDLMVIVLSRNTAGTHMHWRNADGSVGSASRGADYLPGIVDLGDIRGGENSWSTVFEVGIWSQAYDSAACVSMVQALSTRWAFA